MDVTTRHLPIVCFDNRLEPIPISMKNIGYRPIPIPIPILYEALSLHTAGLKLSLIFSDDLLHFDKFEAKFNFPYHNEH